MLLEHHLVLLKHHLVLLKHRLMLRPATLHTHMYINSLPLFFPLSLPPSLSFSQHQKADAQMRARVGRWRLLPPPLSHTSRPFLARTLSHAHTHTCHAHAHIREHVTRVHARARQAAAAAAAAAEPGEKALLGRLVPPPLPGQDGLRIALVLLE